MSAAADGGSSSTIPRLGIDAEVDAVLNDPMTFCNTLRGLESLPITLTPA